MTKRLAGLLLFMISVFEPASVQAGETIRSSRDAREPAVRNQSVVLQCGSALSLSTEADIKRHGDCQEWLEIRIQNDRIWAERLCGGVSKRHKAPVEFDACVVKTHANLVREREAAEIECRGKESNLFRSYSKDALKFETCVREHRKNRPKSI